MIGVGQASNCAIHGVPQQVCDTLYQAYLQAAPPVPVTVTAAGGTTIPQGYNTGATLSIDVPTGATLVSIQNTATGNYQQAFGTPVVVATNATGDLYFTVVYTDANNNQQTAYVNFLNSGPNTPSWTQDNALKTFMDWATAINVASGPPQNWPANTWVQTANDTLTGVISFWNNIGSQNAQNIYAIPTAAWNFPWQYADKSSTDVMGTALQAMLNNPTTQSQLASGQVPAFDPTVIDWTSPGTLFDPNTLPTTAGNVANSVQTFQAFVTAGANCNLFSNPAQAQSAWQQYSSGTITDPCQVLVGPAPTGPTGPIGPLTPLPGLTGPTGPTGPFGGYGPPYVGPHNIPPQGDITPISTTTSTPNWVVPTVAVAGVAALVGVLYLLYRRENPPVAHNPSLRVSYSEYRAGIANQLLNKYGWPYHVVGRVMDMEHEGQPIVEVMYERSIPVSAAAKSINSRLQAAQRTAQRMQP